MPVLLLLAELLVVSPESSEEEPDVMMEQPRGWGAARGREPAAVGSGPLGRCAEQRGP